MLEIDESNIITTGRRTRGKVIDFTKAAEELDKERGVVAEEEEEEEEEEETKMMISKNKFKIK